MKINNSEIESRLGIPVRTLQDWRKKGYGNWREKLLNYLDFSISAEKYTLEELQKVFQKNEIKIMIACINSTIPSEDFFIKNNLWEYHLQDCYRYEQFNFSQFSDKKDEVYIKNIKNTLIEKVNNLKVYEKFVLFNFVSSFWKQEGEKDLNDYVKGFRD